MNHYGSELSGTFTSEAKTYTEYTQQPCGLYHAATKCKDLSQYAPDSDPRAPSSTRQPYKRTATHFCRDNPLSATYTNLATYYRHDTVRKWPCRCTPAFRRAGRECSPTCRTRCKCSTQAAIHTPVGGNDGGRRGRSRQPIIEPSSKRRLEMRSGT